jgi:hypothetical protein
MSKAKNMYAFDHIPVGSSATGGNVPTYSDFPFAYFNSTVAGALSGGTAVDAGGTWLVSGAAGAASNFYAGFWYYPMAQFDLSKARSWIGFRLKMMSANRVNPPLAVWTAAFATQPANLVLGNDYPFVTGQEHYVEVLIDRVNKTRTVWVDSQLAVPAVSYGSYTILSTDLLSFGTNGPTGGSTAQAYQIKDVYTVDDPNDGSVTRMGPIIARPITEASATGAGWNASTGTPLSALNTPVNTTTPSTPNVAFAGDGTPLIATLQTTADPGAVVQGVLLIGSGQRNQGTGTVFRTTITDQATPTPNQQQIATLFPAGSYQYGKSLAFLPNALDGSNWSAAKIAQLTLSNVASAT